MGCPEYCEDDIAAGLSRDELRNADHEWRLGDGKDRIAFKKNS
jgi:hypothetical protein